MRISVVTLFPELVAELGRAGVVGRALEQDVAALGCVNPRDFAADGYRRVDDRPYGGGPGMVMMYEPLKAAIEHAREWTGADARVVCLSPQGRVFDQQAAERFASLPALVLVAGRYEGIDERVVEACVDEELSLGDFVLSGGELAAMVIADAVIRLLPGALGDEASAANDSFAAGRLDHPHYTRPEVVDGRAVPEVLRSGDHRRIAKWRRQEALGRTWQRRPDLVARYPLSDEEQELLEQWRRARRVDGNE